MLSATYSVADVKTALVRPSAFYGYATDGDFTSAVTVALDQARLLNVLPAIGESLYASIQALNKSGLTLIQEYLYQAEVYFAASAFVSARADSLSQEFSGDSISESVDGVSRSVSGLSKGGFVTAGASYSRRGADFLALAGYGGIRLTRGDGPFAPSNADRIRGIPWAQ